MASKVFKIALSVSFIPHGLLRFRGQEELSPGGGFIACVDTDDSSSSLSSY